jgi:hypothetical protein
MSPLVIRSSPPLLIKRSLTRTDNLKTSIDSPTSPSTILASSPVKKTVRVLVVGTTQSGKSAFLRYVHKYQAKFVEPVQIPSALEVGTGDISVTQNVTTYPLTLTPILYQLTEESKHYFLDNETDIQSLIKPIVMNSIKLKETPEEVSSQPLNVEFIDTPGLDEREDKDEEHIINILLSLQKVGEITAVCFVVNSNAPFSDSFIRFFKYYREMIPELSHSLIVVHSRWGLKERAQNMDKIALRTSLFYEKTGHKCTHFFINSVPQDVFSPNIEAFDNGISCATFTALLQYLLAKDNVKIHR